MVAALPLPELEKLEVLHLRTGLVPLGFLIQFGSEDSKTDFAERLPVHWVFH